MSNFQTSTMSNLNYFLMESSSCVFTSNIDYRKTWKDIKLLFEKEVGEVKYVELITDGNNRSVGAAIIKFATPGLATKALSKMDNMIVWDRRLVLKTIPNALHNIEKLLGRPRVGHATAVESRHVQNGSYNKKIPKQFLQALALESAEMENQPLPTGNFRKRPFLLPQPQNLVLQEQPQPELFGKSPQSENVYQQMQYGAFGKIPVKDSSKSESNYGLSPEFLKSLGISSPLSNKVTVANLDKSVSEGNLMELFSIAGVVNSVNISKGSFKNNNRFGYIVFEHPVEAVQAISMLHGQYYMGRKLVVKMFGTSTVGFEQALPYQHSSLPQGLMSVGRGFGKPGKSIGNMDMLH